MTSDAWLRTYRDLNNGFSKKLVFHFGVDSGFFSEYNNMLLAMLYCLKHRIKFVLYAEHTQFGLDNGWNDFFQPFPSVNTHRINKDYNLRPYIVEQSKEAKLQKLIKYKGIVTAYKTLYGIDYLTQDLWAHHRDPAFAHEVFDVPALGLHRATLLEATELFIRHFWRYNERSAAVVAAFAASVPLPAQYVSLHVRAGDKTTEIQAFDFSEYMGRAAQFSANQQAFVLTDDYTVVEQLRLQYPAWAFHTLCEPTERGYFQGSFVRQDKAHKYRHHLRLFAELDLAAASTKFIGTYSSNVGMFMGMRTGEAHCAGVDFPQWVLW